MEKQLIQLIKTSMWPMLKVENRDFIDELIVTREVKTQLQQRITLYLKECEKTGPTPRISTEELEELFRDFDVNRDGFISKSELRTAMAKMGQPPTEDELKAMFLSADSDSDGKIDFQEFAGIALTNPLSMSFKFVFQKIVQEMDTDGDGCIDKNELKAAFEKMGRRLDDAEVKAIYRQVDANVDGNINFDEFCAMVAGEQLNCATDTSAAFASSSGREERDILKGAPPQRDSFCDCHKHCSAE